MGYSEKEKVQVKMELNPAKAELINGFFEIYLLLMEKEEELNEALCLLSASV